eukprot:8471622-Alexandrium_andersonii.AAC.1
MTSHRILRSQDNLAPRALVRSNELGDQHNIVDDTLMQSQGLFGRKHPVARLPLNIASANEHA